MNYKETIDFLFSRLPMFHRIGAAAYKADLQTTIDLNDLLNNPQIGFPSVHIAGTNGKGSTSNFIASILMEAGYNTGLFTSPHLVDFRERIRVNGEMISEDYVVDFIQKSINSENKFFNDLNPSFFELTFALAMSYFKTQKVDIAVVEVGMGGRLDSTNTINSILSIITNIGLDHTAFLGDTIEKIAVEKAGIIKPNIPIIVGRKQLETHDVFVNTAKLNNAQLFYAEDIIDFKVSDFEHNGEFEYNIVSENPEKISSPLFGLYQIENLRTVISSIKILSDNPAFSKLKVIECIKNGIEKMPMNTNFKGRWQILSQVPKIICDTGHNVDGLKITMSQIQNLTCSKLHMVFGLVNDKDVDSILELLPKNAEYYFCKPNIPRGLDENILFSKALTYELYGKIYRSVNEALTHAKINANSSDIIFIGGSTFVVAEVV